MTTLTISLGQMDVQLGQPEANLATVQSWTAAAAERGSDVVVFPELWSTGYDLARAEQYATPITAGVFADVAALARQQQIFILGSCLASLGQGQGQVGNTAVLHTPTGTVAASYSKTHLFQLMDEHHYLTAGDELVTAEMGEHGRVGLAICYDLRFPELFRHYALLGARLVFVPAEWPHPRLAHWRTLLRARAIENQMFIVACNRVGESKGTHFCGHSCIIDPWGETVLEAGGDEAGVFTAVVDLAQVDAVRAQIPIFADRRPHLYP
jgi:omega-amidase